MHAPGLTAIRRLGGRRALPSWGSESALSDAVSLCYRLLQREKCVRKHGSASPQVKHGVWKRVIFACAFASENLLSYRGLS